MMNTNYGHVTILYERLWLRLPLKILHLLKYPWARRLAYYEVARKITNVDKATGTITINKPFPGNVKAGTYIVKEDN